ncbi:MAG TPA: FAD-dependent oxidoreductase, partial [Thermoplasmatales archaeon]|nr:FAD-dependent oxidoreductase [Thermoplasmatales archaeon]
MEHAVDVAVVGGGPAGLAAAVSARERGAEHVMVIDRNSWLGG